MSVTQNRHVLVIDDEEDIRDCIEDFLTLKGFRVTSCKDGSDGMQRFSDAHFDLVITDIMMPGKDGLSTMIAMQKINPSIKILAISGAEMKTELLQAAGMVGAVAMLIKPFTMEELITSIQSILG